MGIEMLGSIQREKKIASSLTLVIFLLWALVHESANLYLGRTFGFHHLSALFFALVAALINATILQGTGYFESYRIVPRTRDLVVLALTLTGASLIAKYLAATIFHYSLLRYYQVLLIAPLLGALAFSFQRAFGLYLRNHTRRSLLLLLLPEEEMELRIIFRKYGLNRGLKMVSFRPWLRETDAKQLESFYGIISSSAALKAHFSELNDILIQAHLRGMRMAQYETVVTDLERKISSTNEAVLRSFQYEGTFQTYLLRGYSFFKALLEPTVALLLLLALSPVILVVMAAIKLTSPGPVFYSQVRVGLNGKLFSILKFRSMRTDAEKNGPMWASASRTDSRLTPIGGFLRASHLDEIPQLWNIVRGDLSFIGPRPERPEFCEKLQKEIPLFHLRTLVRPGVTGWAQVWAGYANSIEDSRTKLEFDLFYINRLSPLTDLTVVAKTVLLLVQGGTEGKKVQSARPQGTARRPFLPERLRSAKPGEEKTESAGIS